MASACWMKRKLPANNLIENDEKKPGQTLRAFLFLKNVKREVFFIKNYSSLIMLNTYFSCEFKQKPCV